jgi:general secretion pathway protein K
MTSFVSNHRGIALILALGVITILMTSALEIYRQARTSLAITGIGRDRSIVREMAASGVHLAMAVLLKDRSETEADNLMEEWANPEVLNQAVSELAFDHGKLEIFIEDEFGRLQANALVKPPNGQEFNSKFVPIWERYLDRLISDLKALETDPPLEFHEETVTNAIINSIKDWIDSGDDDATTGLSGAESEYYSEKEPSYAPANDFLTDIRELLLMKGVTKDLFYGYQDVQGLVHGVTVHGLDFQKADLTYKGKININTARLAVLRALLPEELSDLAEAIDVLRRPDENGENAINLESPNWYKEVPGAGDASIDSELITFQSDTFRVQARASTEEMSETVIAIVQRYQDKETGKFRCRILQWIYQ